MKVKKLISLSTIKQIEWKSASKSVVGLGALLVLFVLRGNLLSILIFGAALLRELKGPLLVWTITNILLTRGIEASSFLWVFLFCVSGIMYFILKQTPIPFLRKKEVKEVASTGLIFLAMISGTFIRDAGYFWVFGLFVCFSIGLLMLEEVKKQGLPKTQGLLVAGATALIVGEVAWIMNFLPLHPISFSAALTLTFLTLKQVIRKSLEGGLHIKAVLQEILVFVVIMLVILGTTSWEL